MATVNKDFKIKSGLIVEGTNATVNGNQILTENAGDQYILDLIGGETLVKSVSNEFDVSVAGELSIDRAVVDAYYDAAGDAAAAETAANSYTDGRETAITTAYEAYADQAEVDAKAYTDTRETAITTAYQSYADTAEQDAKNYADGLASNYDAAGSAAAAQTAAENYADGLIDDNSNLSTEVWSAYKTSTEIGLAQQAAEDHADQAVADLVGSAPELLDTLQELATALQDNPDIIGDLQDVAAGKQDTLTAGANIDITGATISVTGLDSADISDFNTAALSATSAAYDAAGAAATAQSNAEDYADGLAVNYDAAGSATSAAATALQDAKDYADALDTDDVAEGTAQYFTDARAKSSAADLLTGASLTNITITGTGAGLTITAENGVADSDTDDLAEGTTNLYFTDSRALDAVSGSNIQPESVDITWVRREEATWTGVATASKVTCHSAGASEGSMKYLVRVTASVGGTRHSHVTEVLATVDGGNNVAVVEYGTIYTSTNPMATVTVEWNASTSEYDLNVTTANANSEVMVAATLIASLD
jgi:hypothetical protein